MTEPVAAPAPADTFDLEVDGKNRTLEMSFGMLNELAKLMPSLEEIPQLAFDPGHRERVLNVLLAERDDQGKVIKDINLMTTKLSPSNVNAMMGWVVEHVLGFMLTVLEGTQHLTVAFGPRAQRLMSSLGGTKS